jgi:hypothetical protein
MPLYGACDLGKMMKESFVLVLFSRYCKEKWVAILAAKTVLTPL